MNEEWNFLKFVIIFFRVIRMEALAQVCDAHLLTDFKFGHKTASDSEIVSALGAVTPLFNETYLNCKWRNFPENCVHIFKKFITEEGVCYSFNSLSPAEIYRPEGWVWNEKNIYCYMIYIIHIDTIRNKFNVVFKIIYFTKFFILFTKTILNLFNKFILKIM